MNNDVVVTSERTLSNSFLGDAMQICIVTHDIYRTLEQFVRLGVGPWRIYQFDEHSVSNQTYRGAPQTHSLKLAMGWSGSTFWEVIQPLEGKSVYSDWLAKHGEGVQHIAQTCNGIPFEERIMEFERRGFRVSQSGSFQGQVRYAYIDTEDSVGFAVELMDFPEGYAMPEPEEWYPAAPPKSSA
ncbi:VOC family protein [Pseudomonas luteola]|uniref:VOC family protein n=1 Tax=Pseudomonas luteola TaxID=47886 RepID=UPI001239612F|nr:VOC family protein [Pseudomonas luteola]QEU26315.1 VOC family protein [Pseudomonas luteola]